MEYLSNIQPTDTRHFILITAIIFAVIFLRYLFFSGGYHYLFFILLKNSFKNRFLHTAGLRKDQAWQEIRRSALTSAIFAVSGAALIALWHNGSTRLYTSWDAYPVWYHPVSLFLALFIHETYYYWLHRWMHKPGIYRKIHKWHHDSIETSSFTAFSFHPAESLLQAIVVPVLILFLPMHVYLLFLFLLIMTVSGTINHAAVEVYPEGAERHWWWKWVVGATHHDLHHKQFRFNFGLYFTFWDRWMGTESPDFENRFKKQTLKK